jgi:mRNA interferase RelE/StbE
MTYRLRFKEEALGEWRKLGATVQAQFKKKLTERLGNPHVPASRLHGSANRYKIKLHAAGYRLIYEARDEELVVVVIAVGKREKGEAYARAKTR